MKIRWPQDRTLPTAAVIATIVVFMTMAVLLYRWSNQVSRATSVRLADSLQMSMVNWHMNLFRELSDICLALRADSDRPPAAETYARRFMEWKESASYPDVVANIWVVRTTDGVGPAATRLDPAVGKFGSAEWPERFLPVLNALRGPSITELSPAGDASGTSGRFSETLYPVGGLAGWRFDPHALALARPIEIRESAERASRNRGDSMWLLVELDENVLGTRMLPDLARRYFMGVDSLDYLVAVVSGTSPRRVIYSSDPGFGEDEVSDADGRMDVFGGITRKAFGSPIYVFHELSETARLSELAASIGSSWFPLIGESSDDRAWQLVVRHRRGGALGAFVAEMHRRDLAISFGALFLLVAAVALTIVASQRASRLAALKVDFVTAVSHELRSPLAIINSAAENIAHGLVESREQVAQYGEVIVGQARHLSRMVEEVLLFAATQQDRQRYDPRPLQVGDVVDTALAGVSDLVAASQFNLERDVPPDLPQVMGDPFGLSQCLQNLVTNALKYGGDQRWVAVRASVHKAEGTAAPEVRIAVSDRGMGIDPADLPHIFEPFYRSPHATAAQIRGTGLGLALAKRTAEAMGGRLTVQSVPGQGSTFTLHLSALDEVALAAGR